MSSLEVQINSKVFGTFGTCWSSRNRTWSAKWPSPPAGHRHIKGTDLLWEKTPLLRLTLSTMCESAVDQRQAWSTVSQMLRPHAIHISWRLQLVNKKFSPREPTTETQFDCACITRPLKSKQRFAMRPPGLERWTVGRISKVAVVIT